MKAGVNHRLAENGVSEPVVQRIIPASLWMQELGGTGTMVNEAMARLGLEHTRVNSRTEGRLRRDFRRYRLGADLPRGRLTRPHGDDLTGARVINPEAQ